MGRWLALLSTAALIIAAATIDPCKRQPFRGRCPSVSGQPPKRSQFVLRYYARNGECVSYPYGHCATDDSEPQLYRYKEECEDSCINNTPENLGQPKSTSDDNQTYGTLSPKEKESLIVVETAKTEKKTTITSPPTTFKTSESTTSSTTTESVTTTEKATTTEEPVTTTEKITIPITAAETSTTTTHVTTESVAEVTEAEEEVEEEENNVEDEEHVQETTTTPAPTTARATTSAARTECERRREASASSKIRGGFVPVCESNGNFQKVQCEPDGRQCFCVNSNGIEITNSRTRNGIRPDCARIETAVTPKTQSCTGRADRGPCSSSYTRFYYDEATQKCATFPYSGCGGNGNNFETESECNHRCVPAKPAPTASAPSAPATVNDICRLPKERGPCDKYELRFYFNAETKECKYFFWGGCEGNGNNFETAEQCQSSCGVAKANQHNVARTSSQNNGQIKTIPGVRIGNGTVVTGVSGDLEIATPTATAPTTATPTLPQRTVPPTHPTTRFVPQTVQTRASQPPPPQQTAPPQTTRFVSTTTPAPVPPPTPAPIPPNRPAPVVLPGDSEEVDVNRCDHPLDSGSCRGQFVRWFWDNQKQACDVFTYSGCEGNGNNFASREECMAICQREAPPPPSPDFSNVCKHEIDAGECQGVFQRFAFDTEEGECRPFTYGGCGGNGNNFATLAECRTKCEKPPSQAVNVCEFEIEAGECTGVFPRFAYDRETNDCRPFTYGGCGGNGNNFANVNECRNICIKKACNPLGQCDLSHCQVLNDSRGCPFCSCAPVKAPVPVQCPPMDMDRCMEPCIVITNRRGCQECACPQGVSTTAQAPVAPARQPGPPSPSTQPPRPPGHPTRIEAPAAPSRPGEKPRTIPGVESTRTPLSPAFTEEIQEKCLQPMETGPCKSFVDRWFFNREDGSCHPFKYGGCAGNRNHFFTQRECEIHCARFLHPLATNELMTSTSHEHDARDSSQEFSGPRARLGQQRPLAFDLPSVVKGQQSLQLEHNAPTTGPDTYETQAPIKIDLEKLHRTRQETTTRAVNGIQAELTTRSVHKEETEPPAKVSLPVEEYTQTIITTSPLNERRPTQPLLKAHSEEEKEEEEEEEWEPATTERPRPIPKKVPVRQEAARTQSVGASRLSPQNTYSMPAVTNYDPQANSNLEGLSPPVDPTYFTYNSQHLGRRKQFAVNNVPFDKNVPNPTGFVQFVNRPQAVQPEADRKFKTIQAEGIVPAVNEFNARQASVQPVQPQSTSLNQPSRVNPQPVFTQHNAPQFTQQFHQQQQQFVQQRNNFNQQTNFVPPQQNTFNTPRPVIPAPQPFVGDGRLQLRVAPTLPPTRADVLRPSEVRSASPALQPTFASRQQTVAPAWRQPPPLPPTEGRGPDLPRLESYHFDARTSDFTTERILTRQETREPVKFIPSQRNPASTSTTTTRAPVQAADPRYNKDKFRIVTSQGSRFVMEEFSPEEPVQPARSRAGQNVQTTRFGQQITTEAPRPTTTRRVDMRQSLPTVSNEPPRQTFQPVQSAVRTVVTLEKQPLNVLPFHKLEHNVPIVPKRIQFKESQEKVPIVHGIRSGPYGQTHWVYYDGDYYGPLIPGVKVNKTGLEKIDATVAVKEDPERQIAYESFKSQAANFQKSLDLYIKQKEQEQLKREQTAVKATTIRTPFSRHPQGVVMIPVENGPNEDPVVIPVVRTENIRFKDVNKHAEPKLTKNTEKGEQSEEESREEEEPARPVAHGVSRVHVVEPLPVENYHSPEPVLRGAYGKKYLEPATTQGVKITTSTARPTTATTTPTTTTSTTTTAKTTPKIEEVEEEPEEEEEEPEEITTTNGSTTTTQVLKQPKEVEEEAPETKDIGREESSEPQETPSESPESEMEEEEPEEIPELSSAPTTRASRLPVSREESKTEDNESEEEVGEENVSTPVTSPITEAETTTKASSEPAPTKSSTSAATETATEKPEVETTLFNEVNSMEGEEGVEENEITPSSMMSSSKFAVHRQTEEEKKFDEITADLKANPDEKLEVTPKPGLKKVEITPPTMAPATATAPTNEAPTTEAAAVESVSTTAEPSITSGTVQTRAQNIEVTDSTTAATSTASTTQTPTTATTTQSRATTATDSNENEPDFDMTAIKPDNSNSVKAGGLAQQPVDKAVDPTSGIGRQPIPGVTLPDDSSLSTEDLDLEEPTTIFPNPKPTAMVRQTLAPTQASSTSPNTVAQSNKPFNSHDPKIVCSMPAEQGLCNSYVARWFFNYQTGQCEEFSYGGCSGNANNFGNRTLCELTCMPVRSVTSQVPERCSYEKDAGFGKGYNVKWYFNMRNLRCEQFVYEGKGGNDNKFETLSDCERFCSPQPARPVPQRPTLATVPTVPATQAATTLRTAAPTAATLPPSVKTHAAATSRPVPPASPIPTVAPTVPNKLNTLVTLPPVENDNKDSGDDEDYEEVPDDEPMPPIATTNIGGHGANELVQPPGTEPQPPSARGSPVQPVEKPLPVIPTTAATSSTAAPTTQQPIYNANKIVPSDMEDKDPSLRLVGASPKEEVNYSTGRRDKAAGIATFNENRLPPPDLDSKNEDDKFARPSCPNGNKELRYLDGRPVMCLPGKAQCPDRAVCYFNGMDYFCCPNEEDPYDRHVFGGYGGDEARYGYKVFGPLRISRLMDEVPLRAKRQTTMDRAFNTNAASFNLDSVVAPLRFDAEKPRHVSSAARMNRPTVPKHGNPMCILPLVKGECDAAHLRYYYDRNSDSCRLFYYSGCQGNANNFGSLIDCQRLCVLGGQTAPAVQADAVTPATIVAPGQCPDGAPLGGSAPVLCGNSTESIGCPTGYYCRGGPPDICCRGIDPALRNVQHGVKLVAETIPTPGVPRSYYKQSILATPKYMCPDASDPLMAENNEPAVCGAGFDGVKMCPKGYYCAIDGAKGSRLCCPLFGSSASRIPHEYNVIAPSTPRKPSTSREVLDREPLPSGQEKYHQESSHSAALPQPKAEEEDDEEYEDDDAAQQLKIKSGSRNRELQEQAASESSKAADVSKESVNIDIPKEEPVVEETTEPTETPVKQSSDMSICQLKPTEGRACREDEKAPRTNLHYFYSAKDHRCKLYFYRGCGGNENRFEKKADCEALCLNP